MMVVGGAMMIPAGRALDDAGLSTVKNADQIVVLDKGKVVETRTHDELVGRHGCYYELVCNQLELGK